MQEQIATIKGDTKPSNDVVFKYCAEIICNVIAILSYCLFVKMSVLHAIFNFCRP